MRLELKIEKGKEPGRVRYTYPKPTSHRNIQCSRQTEAGAHCCRQAPYSCILKMLEWRITTGLCWEPTNRSSNLRHLRCFTRTFTRNLLHGQLSQKIIAAVILSVTFKLISDGRHGSQAVFIYWLQRAGENNSVAFTAMWLYWGFLLTRAAIVVQPSSLLSPLGFCPVIYDGNEMSWSRARWRHLESRENGLRRLEKPSVCHFWKRPNSKLLLTLFFFQLKSSKELLVVVLQLFRELAVPAVRLHESLA